MSDSYPAFSARLKEIDELVQEHGGGFSVLGRVHGTGDEVEKGSAGDLIGVQVVNFAVQVSLVELWRCRSIVPAAVVGHSAREVAAAFAAGASSLSDATRLALERARVLARWVEAAEDPGAMAAVRASEQELGELLRELHPHITIAAFNAPEATVLTGGTEALARAVALLRKRRIGVIPMDTPGAGHSSRVEPFGSALAGALQGIEPRRSTTIYYSIACRRRLEGDALTPQYWSDAMRSPVLYLQAVELASENGFDLFVEIASHPHVGPHIVQTARKRAAHVNVLASSRRGSEQETLTRTTASLYARGASLDFRAMHGSLVEHCDVPGYHWQRETHWLPKRNVRLPFRAGAGLPSSASTRDLTAEEKRGLAARLLAERD